MIQPPDSVCLWNERDQLGKFPGFTYQSTIQSFKEVGYLLPWWNSSCRPDENPKDEYRIDKILLSDKGKEEINLDQETLVQAEDSPSTSQGISRYERAKRVFSKCSQKVKSEIKKLSGERIINDIDDMAIKVFFDASQKQDYYDKAEKCDLTESEWFSHYNLLAFNAYDLQSSIGTQTAVAWTLCCFKWMPERVLSKKSRFELLLKLCFSWYNFTLELKLRCAANVESILKSYSICRKSFDKLVVKCELKDEDKNVVNSFLNLIKAALLSRISTEQNSEAENYLKEFKDILYFPHVLIALYYYETASMAYFKGDVVALDHLKMAFHHMLSSTLAENIKWKYLLDIVHDLARYYTKVDSATKASKMEFYGTVYFIVKHKQSNQIDRANDVLLALALCHLAIVLERTTEADEYFNKICDFFVKDHSRDILALNSIDPAYLNKLVSFATAVYPHFAKTKMSDISSLVTFVFDCIETQTNGYKYIVNVNFLLTYIQYHNSDPDVNIFMVDCVLNRIRLAYAFPEILSYCLIATMLKGVFLYQQNKPDDGKELLATVLSDSFAKANYYDLASCICKCIQQPSLLQEFGTNFLRNFAITIEKVIKSLAGDQFREKFPSSDENKKAIFKILNHFANECKIKATEN